MVKMTLPQLLELCRSHLNLNEDIFSTVVSLSTFESLTVVFLMFFFFAIIWAFSVAQIVIIISNGIFYRVVLLRL